MLPAITSTSNSSTSPKFVCFAGGAAAGALAARDVHGRHQGHRQDHGRELEGETASALAGPRFVSRWNRGGAVGDADPFTVFWGWGEATVDDLFFVPHLGPRYEAAGQHPGIEAMRPLRTDHVVGVRLAAAARLGRELVEDVQNVHARSCCHDGAVGPAHCRATRPC